MVFLSLAFWLLSHNTSVLASDVAPEVTSEEQQTFAQDAELSAPQNGEGDDSLDYSNASPNRAPAVLPQDDAETLNRRSLYLDGTIEPPGAGDSMDSGVERVPTVIDDQR